MPSHPLGITPTKIIAVHLNYRSRAAERGRMPDAPSYFLKPPSSLAASGAPIVRPQGCELLTVEGEIALVIGTRAHNVDRAHALEHVAGYAPANDVGLHDLREVDRGSNVRSKGADGYTPVGSTLLDARTTDLGTLRLRTWVNDVLVQDAGLDELIFDFGYLVADLSRTITLEPGDLILTGTPTGAGIVGPGDTVTVRLSDGEPLTNPVVEGPALADVGARPQATAGAREIAGPRLPAPAPSTVRPDRLAESTADALGRVSTATLSSQLRKRGIDESFVTGALPVRDGQRLLGRARTLRYLPLREDVFARVGGGMNAQKRAVESLGPGDVLVIECRGEPGSGTIGDILALRAEVRGAAGIVTDGPLRDTDAVRTLQIPTYHAGSHAAVLGRRHVPMDTDLPISCGGVLVNPGDVLVGDGDGVVVIPPDLVDEVAAAALEQEREEAYILERVRAGAGIDGLYPMNAENRAAYRSATEEN